MKPTAAKRTAKGLYEYKGWVIEKMEEGQWNMMPVGSDCWTDAANTLGEAKLMIDDFTGA